MQSQRWSWAAWVIALGMAASSAGCVAHAQAGGYGDANAPVLGESPTLVNVDSDVWVVRDANDPVYYVDGYYWTNGGGQWRRARSYDRGWTVVEFASVPASIARRDHRSYVRYQGRPGAPSKPAPRETLASADDDKGRRKDERSDRKDDRKDERAERKDDRKDERAERKDDRRDAQGERQDGRPSDPNHRKDDKDNTDKDKDRSGRDRDGAANDKGGRKDDKK